MSSTHTSTDESDPTALPPETVLDVEELSVTYRMDGHDVQAVRDVSFSVDEGRTFGIVGESGCGKTTVARAIIGLLDDNGSVTGGAIRKDGRDLTELPEPELRAARWSEIAMIPQNVMNSLNPVETVGNQTVDVIQLHTDLSAQAARDRAVDLFDRVGVDPGRLDDYPHEFSGGMLQRAVIAMAMSCEPDLIVADEPTTALDVVVQDEIIAELRDLQAEFGVSILVISHDIGVMAELCDDLAVMYGGEVMERGTVEDVFTQPSNPYTLGLQNSFPDVEQPDQDLVSIPGTAPDLTAPPQGCVFADRCPFAEAECEMKPPLVDAPGSEDHVSACHFVDEVDRLRETATDPDVWTDRPPVNDADYQPTDDPLLETESLRKYYGGQKGVMDYLFRRDPTPVKAVDGVDLTINEGEMFGIVGESGCGKSTLGRLLLSLESATGGEIRFDDLDLTSMNDDEELAFRGEAQIIFQDPFESLNPRMTVRGTLMEPIRLLGESNTYGERLGKVEQILEDVGLSPASEYLDRFPDQLSGGERQRVAIARALVVDPSFILADEPVSMLDVSIRANILEILRRLRVERDITYGVISHDISLVRALCDRTGVMYLGEFVELGDTDRVVDDPKHPYTQALVDSVPRPDPTLDREPAGIRGETPSARDPPSGCRFHTRCPQVIPPDDYEFDQERFREVMDLRVDLANDSLRRSLAERAADDGGDGDVASAIKARRFSGGFVDPDAEVVVDEALSRVAAGDHESAAALLADEFQSPCERASPEYREEDGRLVACHLY